MRYAIVKDGVTTNIIEWDGEAPYEPPEGAQVVPEDQAPPMPASPPDE